MRKIAVLLSVIIFLCFGGCFGIHKSRIEQHKQKRLYKLGLTVFDGKAASPGYVLFSPYRKANTYLIDMKGNVVHQWNLPGEGGYGYLLPNGNLFYNGKIKIKPHFPFWNLFGGGIMMEVDWDGNVVWEHKDPYQHHDGRRTPGAGVIYLAVEKIPPQIAQKVKGGIPGSGKDGMWADKIVEKDKTGKVIWEWHAWKHLDTSAHSIQPNMSRNEWTHGNTIVPLDQNRLLVSFRNISLVGIINKNTKAFTWKLGDQILAQQHDPRELQNGNILLFDNGFYRKHIPFSFSRVIEIDPKTNKIVWTYQDKPPYNLYSQHISGCQRLPNGNTLIVEGDEGRMFQVTPQGKVVWEYVSPYFHPAPYGLTNEVFKANFYTEGEIEKLIALRKAHGA